MWLIVSSLSPHNQHLLFCCLLSILALIWLVLIILFIIIFKFLAFLSVSYTSSLCLYPKPMMRKAKDYMPSMYLFIWFYLFLFCCNFWVLFFIHTDSHHHHHVVPLARISLTLSHHFSLSFITSGRSSGLHPVSSHSCCMYVRAGLPAFAWSYAGVHRSTSLMSSSLLLQQCPACLVCLAWIVFMMGGRWPYS